MARRLFEAKRKAEAKSKALTAKRLNPLRVPPQTLESEKALLGALMIRPDRYDGVERFTLARGFLQREAPHHLSRNARLVYKKAKPGRY